MQQFLLYSTIETFFPQRCMDFSANRLDKVLMSAPEIRRKRGDGFQLYLRLDYDVQQE